MTISVERLQTLLDQHRKTAGQLREQGNTWWLGVVEENIEVLAEVIHSRVALVAHRQRIEVVLRHMANASRLEVEAEQLQVQLAGCGVAAHGGTKDPAKPGDYGWSPAYQAVLDLRAEVDRLRLAEAVAEAYSLLGIDLAGDRYAGLRGAVAAYRAAREKR